MPNYVMELLESITHTTLILPPKKKEKKRHPPASVLENFLIRNIFFV